MLKLFSFLKRRRTPAESDPAPLSCSYTATQCGHGTEREGIVRAFDDHTETTMPLNESRSVDWCLNCLGNMAVRCAWCGKSIFVGDPITLYSATADFKVPEYAIFFESRQLVGCLRTQCAETGADRAGFWLPGEDGRGRVERVPTAYEAILASGGRSAVVVQDIGDIAEAKNPRLIPLGEE